MDSRTLREKLRLPLPPSKKKSDEPIDSFHDVMSLENTMYNRDVLAGDPVDGDIARLVALVRGVDEEEKVPAVERWLHGAAERCVRERECVDARIGERERKVHAPEDDDNRRLCICDQPEAFPDHETRGEDRGKVEDLEKDLCAGGVG